MAFEKAYGPHGPWAVLFAKANGFLEVRLLKSLEDDSYLTIDRWISKQAFEVFAPVDIASLDAQLERPASREMRLGAFESV